MWARWYTQIVGIVLTLLGLFGFLIGDGRLLFNFETSENIIHLILGVLGVVVGFFVTGDRPSVWYAYGVGVLLVLIGLVGFFDPTVFGIYPAVGVNIADNLFHLIVGGLGLAAGLATRPVRPAAA